MAASTTKSLRQRTYWQNEFATLLKKEQNELLLLSLSDDDIVKMAAEVEKAIHRQFKQDADYERKTQQIRLNMDKDSYVKNTYFCQALLNGIILPQNVAKLTGQELFPAHWKDIMAAKDAKVKKEVCSPKATTDMFTCPKCKNKQTTYYEQQTRSADEPMTVFIACVFPGCGKQWRQ